MSHRQPPNPNHLPDFGELDRLPAPEKGSYRCIYADPPWIKYQTGKHGAGEHYNLMTMQRLYEMADAIRYLAADNSFCFMWVTTATLPDGLALLKEWGFTYKSFYVWVKPHFRLGGYFRNAAEILLLGTRGKGAASQVLFNSQPNWGLYPLGEHSKKPEEIFTVIDRLTRLQVAAEHKLTALTKSLGADRVQEISQQKYLELFARRRPNIATPWQIWGDEVDADISLAPWGFEVPADHHKVDTPILAADKDDLYGKSFLIPGEAFTSRDSIHDEDLTALIRQIVSVGPADLAELIDSTKPEHPEEPEAA